MQKPDGNANSTDRQRQDDLATPSATSRSRTGVFYLLSFSFPLYPLHSAPSQSPNLYVVSSTRTTPLTRPSAFLKRTRSPEAHTILNETPKLDNWPPNPPPKVSKLQFQIPQVRCPSLHTLAPIQSVSIVLKHEKHLYRVLELLIHPQNGTPTQPPHAVTMKNGISAYNRCLPRNRPCSYSLIHLPSLYSSFS